MRAVLTALVALVLAVVAVPVTPAAAGPQSLEDRIFQAFSDADYRRAASLLERYLTRRPNDPVMLYNAACAYCHLGDRDTAAGYLRRAVQAGLRDMDQIVSDPDLEAIRDHPTYLEIVERVTWSAAREADAVIARWRALYGDEEYRYEKDDTRRLCYATALDEESHGAMRRMLEAEADHLLESFLPALPKAYVLIAVPTPRDARRLFDTDQIGGLYEHSKRTLIARDIGASLRHEFFHAMHYAHMEEVGQTHPLWVQEGLASLYEDYVLTPDGGAVFLPNERHNVVKLLASGGRLARWERIFTMSEERFMARASQLYPQVRSIFEFLADKDKLVPWYEALVAGFDRDKSGRDAFEEVFGMPVTEVERAWRRWLLARPRIDTTVDLGDASLGIVGSPDGSNDGVVIERILAGSAAEASRLEEGDTIVQVDGVATRSLAELQAVIARKRVGEPVRIRARRGEEYFAVVIRLKPLRPMKW